MENFIVSALKYRPQNFDSMVGQAHITTTLRNAITQNHLAHAFLFCGPRGVGKTSCARILAKTINCTNKTKEGEACNICQSCKSFDNGTSMNIHELDAASNNSVDDIRTLVDQVRFAPQAGDYKVYIIDEVHMLTSAAFNAFLKTLEEPPAHAIFILATTEKHKIIPTILSRCQIFDFKRISTADTVLHLQEIAKKEDIAAEETALHVIAQKSEGCMRDALSILDKIVSFTGGEITYANTLEHLNILDEDYFFKMQGFLAGQQLTDALILFDEILQKGFEGDTFVEGYTEFLRNLLVSTDPKAVSLLDVPEEFKARYLQEAQLIAADWMVAALNLLTSAGIEYKLARNKKLFLEMLLIKLSYLQQAVNLIAEEGNGLEKKKLVHNFRAVSFRPLGKTAMPDRSPGAKQLSHKPAKKASITIEERPVSSFVSSVEEKVIPATKVEKLTKINEENAINELPVMSLGSLKNIRAAVKRQKQAEMPAMSLTQEKLAKAVTLHVTRLHEAGNDLGAANLDTATFLVEDDTNFKITVDSPLQEKFIASERSGFLDFLQDHFNNRLIKFTVDIRPQDTIDNTLGEPKLNRKEQYRLLVEKYPLIQKLKETLKLELE